MSARLKFLTVLAALLGPALAGCGLPGLTASAGSKSGPIRIETQQIYLNPEQPDQNMIGVLEYRGGLALSSNTGNFGGLSGLSLSPGGDALIAVTDQGDLLRAKLLHDKKGRLKGLGDVRLHRLRGVDGKHLSRRADKRDQDAEAIERLAGGGYLVSFEIRHRVLRYEGLRERPTLFSIPPGIEGAPRNGGLEAMTPLPDGRILVLTEKFRAKGKNKGDYIGWLLDADGKSLGRVYWPGFGIFRPTDLAALPNGDVLLLQRRYTVAGGPGMRLSQISAARIKPGARLLDVELAQMAPPLAVDNFEGLAVVPDPAGGWTVYLLSDDNFNLLQRTLLLQFHLKN
jgi:hypothetical protein